MSRRTHYAVERLSREGRAVVHRGLRENWTYARILAELRAETRERVARSSLARYAARLEREHRTLRERQEQARAILAEVKAGDVSSDELAAAMLTQAIADNAEALKKADPIAAIYAKTAQDRIELKRLEVELRRREIEFNERKLAMLEERQRRIEENVKRATAPENVELTEAEKARIRRIYGLDDATAA